MQCSLFCTQLKQIEKTSFSTIIVLDIFGQHDGNYSIIISINHYTSCDIMYNDSKDMLCFSLFKFIHDVSATHNIQNVTVIIRQLDQELL